MTLSLRQFSNTQHRSVYQKTLNPKSTAIGIVLSIFSIAGVVGHSTSTSAQRTVQFELDSAICNNQWSKAIDITSGLIGNEAIAQQTRTDLLALRQRLEQHRAEDAVVAYLESCDRTAPYKLTAASPSPVQPRESLGWEAAVVAATPSQNPTKIVTESVPFSLPIDVDSLAGLTPANPIDLSQGMSVVSGQVGTGHQVYSFVAGLGDEIAANLDVTEVMVGTLYTSDDSQLFIFDRNGKLLVTADDTSGQQSSINNFVIPKTDVYYAVVTSYNNDPILSRDDRLTGWQDNGGGRFKYTLTLSGATRTDALIQE